MFSRAAHLEYRSASTRRPFSRASGTSSSSSRHRRRSLGSQGGNASNPVGYPPRAVNAMALDDMPRFPRCHPPGYVRNRFVSVSRHALTSCPFIRLPLLSCTIAVAGRRQTPGLPQLSTTLTLPATIPPPGRCGPTRRGRPPRGSRKRSAGDLRRTAPSWRGAARRRCLPSSRAPAPGRRTPA